jgi:hypothetical protein
MMVKLSTSNRMFYFIPKQFMGIIEGICIRQLVVNKLLNQIALFTEKLLYFTEIPVTHQNSPRIQKVSHSLTFVGR